MPSATIGKQFTFHAAHRLPNHDGQCQRPHGHSYRLEVLVTGPVAQPVEPMSEEGMVLDFAVLKDIYKNHIEPYVEHQNLNMTLNVPAVGYHAFVEGKSEPLTTCENLALWMLGIFKAHLPHSEAWPFEVCIRLWETPTSFAEVGKAPWRG